jgi:hypothetical protein
MTRYTIAVLKLILMMLWPVSVMAAASAPVEPFGISGMQVLVMSVISTLSGLTALTIRIDAELKKIESETLPRPRLFVSSHMLGSWLAGVLAFSLAEQSNVGIWAEIIAVTVASFSGARFVEAMSEKYLDSVSIKKDKE